MSPTGGRYRPSSPRLPASSGPQLRTAPADHGRVYDRPTLRGGVADDLVRTLGPGTRGEHRDAAAPCVRPPPGSAAGSGRAAEVATSDGQARPRGSCSMAWRGHRASTDRWRLRVGARRTAVGARLTTIGRRSGRAAAASSATSRTAPTSSHASSWARATLRWLNLEAHPDAVVRWAGRDPRPVRARASAAEERDRLWQRWAVVDPEARRVCRPADDADTRDRPRQLRDRDAATEDLAVHTERHEADTERTMMAQTTERGFVALFDGRTLDGW